MLSSPFPSQMPVQVNSCAGLTDPPLDDKDVRRACKLQGIILDQQEKEPCCLASRRQRCHSSKGLAGWKQGSLWMQVRTVWQDGTDDLL